jgi:hypothetical protein
MMKNTSENTARDAGNRHHESITGSKLLSHPRELGENEGCFPNADGEAGAVPQDG